MTFTRQVGEVGVEGTRVVKPGGVILFNSVKIQHERLVPFVGKLVFCWDADSAIYIHVAKYPMYKSTGKAPIPFAGNWLLTIYEDDYLIYR